MFFLPIVKNLATQKKQTTPSTLVVREILPSDGPLAHVFTDGSAFFNESWEHCLSGGAAIEVFLGLGQVESTRS